MKKRLLSLLLALVLVLGAMPFTALADGASIVAQGTCGDQGDNVTWVLTDDGVLTISGTGAMADYTTTIRPEYDAYKDQITSVVIGEGITAVGDYTFCGGNKIKYSTLEAVSFSNTVTRVGKYAFRYAGIKELETPASILEFGDYAFGTNSQLEKVIINGSVLGVGIFSGCNALKEVYLNGNVSIIPNYAFSRSSGLASIKLPETVRSIGEQAFLSDTALKVINIPTEIVSIGSAAFSQCTSLDIDVVFPNTLTTLGNGAFQNTAIKSVVIPDAIKTLGNRMFSGCGALENVTLNEGLEVIQNEAFYNCFSLTELVFPRSLTTIEEYRAFAGCEELTTLTIYNKLTSIGYSAFENCGKLATVNFHGTEEEWNAISGINQIPDTATVVFRTFADEKPVVKAENVKSSGKIKLTIEPVEDAVSYKIFVATTADGEYKLAKETTALTYTYSGKAGTKYFFKVVAVNEAGAESAESDAVSKVQLPAQVTSLKATSKKGQVTLKWKKVTGAKKYEIYMSKNGKTGWKKVGSATKNTFIYKKGKVGQKLYFKVRAVTSNGKKGEFSKVVSVKVKK